MRFIKSYFYGILIIAAGIFITGCQPDTEPELRSVASYDHKIIAEWNIKFSEIEKYQAGYRPGPATWALAYMGLSAYEAVISGMPNNQSIQSQIPGLVIPAADANKEYNWPLVINASYNYLMPRFFGNATQDQLNQITQVYTRNLDKYSAGVAQDVIDRSIARGIEVADIVWKFENTDPVGHDFYKDQSRGYDWQQHYNKVGDWVPEFPGPGYAVGGIAGEARVFSITENEKICAPPIPFSTEKNSLFYAQVVEVYNMTKSGWHNEEYRWIGQFWSDDCVGLTFSPGTRWMVVGIQVLELENSNLETAVLLAAKLGMSLSDANVSCWKSKYVYNLERPVTFIHREIDPNWNTTLDDPISGDKGKTPSFPAYPSGHSTMGAAAAEILSSIFGYDYSFIDKCHEGATLFNGTPRPFSSFYEAMNENAWSRLPLGVHFRMDSEEGVKLGLKIGRKVNQMKWSR